MTVVTIVFFSSKPLLERYEPMMYMILSPSTISPFSSTAIKRSLSPSKARPIAAPTSFTFSCKCSGWVEPTPSLMFKPSGFSPMTVNWAPKSAKIWRALVEAAPFAVSKTTCMPSSWTPVDTRNSWYLRKPSGYSMTVPKPWALGRGSVSSAASSKSSISSSRSSSNLKPSPPKNLMPLSKAGLWLAEIITPALAFSVRTR